MSANSLNFSLRTRRTPAVALICLLSSSWTRASASEQGSVGEQARQRLTSPQRSAIAQAFRGGFTVRVLARQDDGATPTKVVVLVGETHVMAPETRQTRDELLSQFGVVGFEAYRPTTPSSRLFLRVYSPLTRGLNRLAALGRRPGGSAPREPAEVNEQVRYHLEEGHRPRWDERLVFTELNVTFGLLGLRALAAALAQLSPDAPVLDLGRVRAMELVENVLALRLGISAAAMAAKRRFDFVDRISSSPWFYLLSPLPALVSTRNKTMARNIVAQLAKTDEVTANSLGRQHVNGVTRQLQRYGFVDVPLSQLTNAP